MSNQSGITCTPELIEAFKEYIDSGARSLIVKVESEAMVAGQLVRGSSSLADDWTLIAELLSETEPAFVVVKKDGVSEHIFISYTPDYANVRSKMLYASSKNTLLRELGIEFFSPILFVNELDEISDHGWKTQLAHQESENPRTKEEQSLQEIKHFENLQVGTGRRTQLVNDTGSSTLVFKVDQDLRSKLSAISDGELVSCSIDNSDESVNLSQDSSFKAPSEALGLISTSGPQYTVLQYKGKTYFIYSCPSGSKVKDRMIYASNKKGFVSLFLEKELGLKISHNVEVGDLDEVEMSIFNTEDASHGQEAETAKSLRFSKPKGPRRR